MVRRMHLSHQPQLPWASEMIQVYISCVRKTWVQMLLSHLTSNHAE